MKRHRYSMLVIGTFLSIATVWAQSQEPGSEPLKPFMHMKLEPAKKILEGIALEDYEVINSSAQRINALTFDANWMTIQTEEYRQHSQDFQRSLTALSQAAKKKNLEMVTLGYMQMTLQCVQCHRALRD